MRTLILLSLLLIVPATLNAAEDKTIGHVRSVAGEALITRNGAEAPAEVGSTVQRTDVLIVKGEGSLGVTFLDNSRVSIGPNSRLRLAQFEFEPAENKLSFLMGLVRGTMLYVSGVIGKLSPESVSVETPVATIALRGTKLLARVAE